MRFYDVSIYGKYFMTRPQLMVKDPEIARQILVKDFDHFTDRNTKMD